MAASCFAEIYKQSNYLDRLTYQGIKSFACTRLLNAQGMIGCSPGQSGTSGILYQISSEAEVDAFLSSQSGSNWVVVMPTVVFNQYFHGSNRQEIDR